MYGGAGAQGKQIHYLNHIFSITFSIVIHRTELLTADVVRDRMETSP